MQEIIDEIISNDKRNTELALNYGSKILLKIVNDGLPWDNIKADATLHGITDIGFYWTQFTPHFMDGDVCQFEVNIDEYENMFWMKVGDDVQSGWNLDGVWDEYMEELKKKYKVELKQLCAGLNSLPETIFKYLGEGAVFVSKDALTVEEYDHN